MGEWGEEGGGTCEDMGREIWEVDLPEVLGWLSVGMTGFFHFILGIASSVANGSVRNNGIVTVCMLCDRPYWEPVVHLVA